MSFARGNVTLIAVTFPVAWYFARKPYRRGPLVVGVCVLEGGLLLFMLCRPYWVMVVSRFLQGAASTVVWTGTSSSGDGEGKADRAVGFALM